MTKEKSTASKKDFSISKIEKVLEELVNLFSRENWELSFDDWMLAGEWALALQGWGIQGRFGHIDIFIARDRLPWQTEEKYRTGIPPKNSSQFQDYIDFVEKTGFGLDMFLIKRGELVTPELLRTNSVERLLPGGKKIRLFTPISEVLDHYWMFEEFDEGEVGQENLDRWWDYIRDIRFVAAKRNDKKVVDACEKLLGKYEKEF